MTSGRVLVAMSGGVDSSVCARLLVDAGYECTGATMRLATNEDDCPGERTCCSTDDIADARQACWDAGIRHRVFDYSREFARDVIDPFVAAYKAGLTPNPCVACNRHLKFGALLDLALELGYDHVATGHYARITHDAAGWHLLRGVDARKDQSYFLFGLTQERLAHVMFPLGGMLKDPEVRELAASYGLTSANKKDSEGICFVPGGDHLRFIEGAPAMWRPRATSSTRRATSSDAIRARFATRSVSARAWAWRAPSPSTSARSTPLPTP